MNYRLHVFGWKPGKNPDKNLADHLTTYDHSKYQEAYWDFLQVMGRGSTAQLILIDLDNRRDHVVLYDSRDDLE
jgi:hypothetical protein